MEYVVTGTWFINDINFADGKIIRGLMGGSGLFAYCGLLQYTDKSLFLGAAGSDFDASFGEWMARNKISREGLVFYDNPTTLATMYYEPDGRWHEEFQFGPIELGYDISYSGPVVIKKMDDIFSQRKTKGVYYSYHIFSRLNAVLREMRKKYGFKSMIEFVTEDCVPKNYAKIVDEILPDNDSYSLNRPESFSLFSVDSEEAAIEKMIALGKPCFYRVGSKGSYMVMDGKAVFVPTEHLVPKEEEVDVTGCGNCSTAAAFWAFCEGYSQGQIAAIANIAASYNVQQYGPYLNFDTQVRETALRQALELAKPYT
jgi:sugar/nucleoside kinase (ribokinase family)